MRFQAPETVFGLAGLQGLWTDQLVGTGTHERPWERVELLDRERLEQFINLHVDLLEWLWQSGRYGRSEAIGEDGKCKPSARTGPAPAVQTAGPDRTEGLLALCVTLFA